MGRRLLSAATLGLTIAIPQHSNADTVPQILANFPTTQDESVKKAFSDRVRANFPRDIRTSTLTALLEMDGFTVSRVGIRYTARLVDAEFPCITDYAVSWGENERGHVTEMQVAKSHKCV